MLALRLGNTHAELAEDLSDDWSNNQTATEENTTCWFQGLPVTDVAVIWTKDQQPSPVKSRKHFVWRTELATRGSEFSQNESDRLEVPNLL